METTVEADVAGPVGDADDGEKDTPTTDSEDIEANDEDDESDGSGDEQETAGKRRQWRRAGGAAARRLRPSGRARTEPRRWIRSAVRGVAAVVLGAVLAAAGYAGWLLYQQHQTDIDTAQALDAAKQYAVTLTSTDPNAVDKNFNDILNGATGEFKDQYTRAGSLLRKAMIDNQVATHGTVLESAVKSAHPGKVEILLFVEQSVTNSTTPQPAVEVNAIAITMEKVGGRWLASKVVLPGKRR